VFKAKEFSGFSYSVHPGASFAEILEEGLSEQKQALRISATRRFGQLSYSVANAARRVGRFDLVKENYRAAVETFSGGSNDVDLGWTYWGMGNYQQQTGDYFAAFDTHAEGYRIAVNAGATDCALYCLAGMAEVSRIVGDLKRAVYMHQFARSIFYKIKDVRGIVWANEGLAQISMRTGNVDHALAEFAGSMRLSKTIGDTRGTGWARRGMAECYLRLRKTTTAELFALSAIEDFRRSGVTIGIGYAFLTRARIRRKLGDYVGRNYHLELAIGSFKQAQHQRGLDYARYESKARRTDALLPTASNTIARTLIT
jgi:tetratricopeptide (TPR) repeat protein